MSAAPDLAPDEGDGADPAENAPAGESPEDLDFGRWLFAQNCQFVMGAARLDQVPASDLPEVAFAGRSNVGKSSLLNAMTGRKTLARTSNTPGRTQQINFFDLAGQLMLVDLPGYGYARASKQSVKRWTSLTGDYLRGRAPLRRVCVLVDARHGLKESDRGVLSELDEAAVSYQIVLTKIDKCSTEVLARLQEAIAEELARRPAAHPRICATSALKGLGIAELRALLAAMARGARTG